MISFWIGLIIYGIQRLWLVVQVLKRRLIIIFSIIHATFSIIRIMRIKIILQKCILNFHWLIMIMTHKGNMLDRMEDDSRCPSNLELMDG